MFATDLNEVDRLSNEIHPDHPESPEVFAERLDLFPEGCFVTVHRGNIGGYCISHPGVLGEPPPLNSLLGGLPGEPECLHLHDLALSRALRGFHLPSELLPQLCVLAKRSGMRFLTGVAVHNTASYWARHGFVATPLPAQKLQSYGKGAQYITLDLRDI